MWSNPGEGRKARREEFFKNRSLFPVQCMKAEAGFFPRGFAGDNTIREQQTDGDNKPGGKRFC
jgi:hypothetical protein